MINQLNNKNIVFIGMPSVGKSYFGRKISKKYNLHYVDCDILMEHKYGKKLGEILKELGNIKFCEFEEKTICNIFFQNTIISPGGSVVYSSKIMNHLKNLNSIFIYLYLDINLLKKRLGNLKKRGVIIKHGMTFQNLFNEREILYEKYSDFKIDCTNKTEINIMNNIHKIIFNQSKL
tara:strand:- start:7 stop:537 length:531 start_codon:yes stop_codon:yes gene_type:complete